MFPVFLLNNICQRIVCNLAIRNIESTKNVNVNLRSNENDLPEIHNMICWNRAKCKDGRLVIENAEIQLCKDDTETEVVSILYITPSNLFKVDNRIVNIIVSNLSVANVIDGMVFPKSKGESVFTVSIGEDSAMGKIIVK